MRRGDHPRIGFNRVVPTYPVKMPVRQHPQQAGLQIKRHVANLVEKKRAALGLLKAPTPHSLRAGKGAALMAEQFTLQQIFWNGSRVDCNKRATRPARVLMQRFGNQLFTGARFASNHDGDIALAQAPNRPEHVLHGRCLAEHFWSGGHALFKHFFSLAFFNGAANQLNRFRQIKRLRQVFKCATLKA